MSSWQSQVQSEFKFGQKLLYLHLLAARILDLFDFIFYLEIADLASSSSTIHNSMGMKDDLKRSQCLEIISKD